MIRLIKDKGYDQIAKRAHYFPRWTSKGTVTKKALAKVMARSSTFSVGGKAQAEAKDVTAEGVEVGVVFTPDKEMRERLRSESEFQFVSK